MLRNYIKMALRQVFRKKSHNAINIVGLAIGLSVSLVITLYVVQELNFDRFHEKGDRIYLLPMTWKIGDTRSSYAQATYAAGPFVKQEFSQVENMVRIMNQNLVFTYEGSIFRETRVFVADSTFFNVFTFPMIAGNAELSLREPMSIVLTESSARKYFGDDWQTEALTSSLSGQNGKLYRITGVVKDPPVNSHIQFDMLLSMTSYGEDWETAWDSSDYLTYVLLNSSANPAEIVSKIPALMKAKTTAWASENIELDLVPLSDLHLRNPKYGGIENSSDICYIYIFSAIAVMVLVIALINYMNLSTARSIERAKEVGVRKVAGANRRQLFSQFIGESFLTATISMILAIVITFFSLPYFNSISGKQLSAGFILDPTWLLYLSIALVVITFLGGSYPALALSSFKPIVVLKSKLKDRSSGLNLRRVLVIFQFSISIVLIICTLMIRSQLDFMSRAKVGFDKEQLVAFEIDSLSRNNLSVLRTEFAATPGVNAVTATINLPVNVTMRSSVRLEETQERQMVPILGTDREFVEAAGLTLIAGRNFVPTAEDNDRWELLVNEATLKFYGWSANEALGKELRLWGIKGQVVGVVKDFHFKALHKVIEPLILSSGNSNRGRFNYLLARVEGADIDNVIDGLEDKWKQLAPGSLFSFSFLDARYHELYASEARLSRIMNVFSGLAIFIAALGLFGLASHSIVQRTKELGIRKVLGASMLKLIILVSRSFTAPVIVAFLLAVPVSWYAMDRWFQNFHYHIGFNWWLVLLSGVATFVLAIGTVIYHSIEVARVNPTESLRNE